MKTRMLANLLSKYERPNDSACWTWTAARDPNGYGRFWDGSQMRLAHRVVYSLHRGPILDGLPLDHLCRNTSCVNPEHLEPVTHKVNMERSSAGQRQAVKTHCPKGHEYTEANTYVGRSGSRFCRTCHNKVSNQARDQRRSLKRNGNQS